METPKPQPVKPLAFVAPRMEGNTSNMKEIGEASKNAAESMKNIKKAFLKKPFVRQEHLTHRPFAGLKSQLNQK